MLIKYLLNISNIKTLICQSGAFLFRWYTCIQGSTLKYSKLRPAAFNVHRKLILIECLQSSQMSPLRSLCTQANILLLQTSVHIGHSFHFEVTSKLDQAIKTAGCHTLTE